MNERHPRDRRYMRLMAGIILGLTALTGIAYGAEAAADDGFPSYTTLLTDLAGLATGIALTPFIADKFVPSRPPEISNDTQLG